MDQEKRSGHKVTEITAHLIDVLIRTNTILTCFMSDIPTFSLELVMYHRVKTLSSSTADYKWRK